MSNKLGSLLNQIKNKMARSLYGFKIKIKNSLNLTINHLMLFLKIAEN